jgi:hypothetical protein
MAYGDTAWPYFGYVPSSYGKYWFEPVLEVADSSDFTTTNNSAKNKYNYSVIIPKHGASTQVLKEVMQRDLLNYFNKYAVSVENRLMPFWSLVSEKDAIKKLKSKGGVQNTKSNLQEDGLTLMNYPIASSVRRQNSFRLNWFFLMKNLLKRLCSEYMLIYGTSDTELPV